MKQLDLSTLSEAEKNARLAAAATVYGTGSRSYNRSAEKKESDRQRKEATERFMNQPRNYVTVGPVCTCASFNRPHLLERHRELSWDGDWRTESQRRGFQRYQEPIR